MNKQLCALSLIACFSINAMEETKILRIKPTSLFVKNDIGEVELYHTGNGFTILQNNEEFPISKYSMDPLLKKMNRKQLKKFQKIGYLEVKRNAFNEFSLASKVRGNGGGPVTGAVLYWLTKTLCYGTAVAAVGAGVAATGGAVVAAGTAIAGAAGATAAGASVTAIGIGLGSAVSGTAVGAAVATAPVAIVAGGITATAGGTAIATTLTGATLAASGGCVATMVAGVETASIAAFAAGLAIPFLP